MDVVYYLILIVLLLVGWFINILGLPGLWLMVASYGIYAWWTGWDHYVGWASLITLIVIGLIAEIVEFLAGVAGSGAAGGRKRGMIGAIAGGLVGGIALTPFIPIPVVGTIIGACAGAFIGAAIMEFTDRDVAHSFRVGVGAAKGRLYGIISKLAFGGVMFLIAALAGLPFGASAPAVTAASAVAPVTTQTAAPASMPATAPVLP